jgi:hypothetical protein
VTEISSEPAGGLLGLLQEAMRQSQLQPDAGLEPSPQDAPPQAAAISQRSLCADWYECGSAMTHGHQILRPGRVSTLHMTRQFLNCSTANRCDAG